MEDARKYIDSSKLQDAISESITTILRERPENPVMRMSELLAAWGPKRFNTLMASPADAKYKLAVVQFKVPGAKNGGSDKGPDGNRVDSIPIANSVIQAGGACDLILYDADKHEDFVAATAKYDALIVRINPGQLSQGTPEGTQMKFDDLMNKYISEGKLVWSSPKIQTQMGAKDALVKIKDLGCGLTDTLAFYSPQELADGFKATCAYQPRVIKQNRGSAGEGIWLCWLCNDAKEMVPLIDYPSKAFEGPGKGTLLKDTDMLKLMEMNDNHVEYHTVKEFLTFCVDGPTAEGAGTWTSTFPGKYSRAARRRAASSSTSGCCRASTRARCAFSWRATRARWPSTRSRSPASRRSAATRRTPTTRRRTPSTRT